MPPSSFSQIPTSSFTYSTSQITLAKPVVVNVVDACSVCLFGVLGFDCFLKKTQIRVNVIIAS